MIEAVAGANNRIPASAEVTPMEVHLGYAESGNQRNVCARVDAGSPVEIRLAVLRLLEGSHLVSVEQPKCSNDFENTGVSTSGFVLQERPIR